MASFRRFPDIGNIELLHAAYQKQIFSPHFHEGHVIGVIEKGCLGFDYRGERVVAGAGDINMADPGEVHNGFSVSEEGWQYRMFYMKAGQLDRIFNECCDQTKPMPLFKKGVMKIREYIENFYDTDISLDDLSRMAGISRYYLLRVFERETGLTPHTYLNLVRVKRARALMEKNVSIIETAHATGFFDQSHLNRAFKKFYGITPGQFCEKKRKKT